MNWNGRKWEWGERHFRSLRQLKASSSYKIETQLSKQLSQEITAHFNEELLNELEYIMRIELFKKLNK